MPQILFITSSRLGDAVLSTIVLNALIDQLPNAQITVACGPVAAPLFADHPQVKQTIVVHKKRFSGHWWLLWRAVYHQRWDYVIDLRGSALSYVLKAHHRFIFRSQRQAQLMSQQLRTWICNKLNIPVNDSLMPSIVLSQMRHDRIKAHLLELNAHPIIAVAPKANWALKEWPAHHFLELIHKLIKPTGPFAHYKVVVCAAPHEHTELENFKQQLGPHLLRLPHDLDLLDLAVIMQHCQIFIGNDSGLMHVAAALNISTYGLFGPSPDHIYHPCGAHAYAIRTPESYTQLWQKVKQGTTGSLMDSITVAHVLYIINQTHTLRK